MKIGIVFDGLQVGGIERVGLDYVRMFQKKGYDVTVFNIVPSLNAFEKEIAGDCPIIRFSFPRWLSPERYAATIKARWWGKFVYPIAYIFCFLLSFLYKIFLKISNKAIREQYDIAIAFSGHVNDLTVVANSIVCGKRKIAWLHGALYGYAIISPGFLRLYSKIKNLVSLSDSCDAELYKYINENQINKRTIYNPIFIKNKEIDFELVNKLKEKYGDFCLMVGRLADDKDQITAIKAIKSLNIRYLTNKKLVLVGDGVNRKKIESFIHKEKLDDIVFLAGNRTDVQNFYKAATIYVHSSPLEGLPTVLLEAMQYELPIASTDSIPGVREILGNEQCGLISPIFDEQALADNIYKLYSDTNLSHTLIKNGKKRIFDFSPLEIEGKIMNFISDLEK